MPNKKSTRKHGGFHPRPKTPGKDTLRLHPFLQAAQYIFQKYSIGQQHPPSDWRMLLPDEIAALLMGLSSDSFPVISLNINIAPGRSLFARGPESGKFGLLPSPLDKKPTLYFDLHDFLLDLSKAQKEKNPAAAASLSEIQAGLFGPARDPNAFLLALSFFKDPFDLLFDRFYEFCMDVMAEFETQSRPVLSTALEIKPPSFSLQLKGDFHAIFRGTHYHIEYDPDLGLPERASRLIIEQELRPPRELELIVDLIPRRADSTPVSGIGALGLARFLQQMQDGIIYIPRDVQIARNILKFPAETDLGPMEVPPDLQRHFSRMSHTIFLLCAADEEHVRAGLLEKTIGPPLSFSFVSSKYERIAYHGYLDRDAFRAMNLLLGWPDPFPR